MHVRMHRSLVLLGSIAALAACDGASSEQRLANARSDSVGSDSVMAMKNELLNEVMTSTQFITEINAALAKAKALQDQNQQQLATSGGSEAELNRVRDERRMILGRIQTLVARLDSAEARLEDTRARARSLARRDSNLTRQVAQYERTIANFRKQVQEQRVTYQAVIDSQNVQIAELSTANTQLAEQRQALTDTLTELVTQQNTVYYVAGTKDELMKKGILVEEGGRRFLLVGSRPVHPARALDTTSFVRIDRLRDSVITLPAGEYQILTRQNQQFAAPFSASKGKIAGGLKIQQPERFWETSKFLILLRT